MEGIAFMMLKTERGDIKLPVMEPKIVPVDMVQANNYNPNNVSRQNMQLLYQSIKDCGFCYAVTTVWDADLEKYVVVDGFHRYTILKDWFKATEIPILVLDMNISQRMAATVQFNRARGVHQVELMGDLVQSLVEQGVSDEEIATHLGMEEEEVFRLKQVTGIAELFKNQTYSRAWEMKEVNDDI